jgi:hypothetical protein
VLAGAKAGINQWRDHPYEWGQGTKGYGRRLGSSIGQNVIDGTIHMGVAVLRGEDPRYFRSECRGTWARMKYALAHTLVARNDKGGRTFAAGRVAGALGGGLISRAWQPDRHRSLWYGFESGGISIGAAAGMNVLREFWPDIKKRLGSKNAVQPSPGIAREWKR